jgi:hypothetical protein
VGYPVGAMTRTYSTRPDDLPAVLFEDGPAGVPAGVNFASTTVRPVGVVVPRGTVRPLPAREPASVPTEPLCEEAPGGAVEGQRVLLMAPKPVVVPPLPEPAPAQLVGMWEGSVEDVTGESMFVRLVDLVHGRPEEVAQLDLHDVSEDDLPLVREGATFYWSIVRVRTAYGRVQQRSEVRFRRFPSPSANEEDAARAWAAAVYKLLSTSG